MFVLRDVQKGDLPELQRLAAVLNTVNLPNNKKTLTTLVEHSLRSFSGKIRDPFQREYVFVLEDVGSGRAVGTSMVIAQHGTRDAPHIYTDVSQREHYSATVDKHFRHTVLSIGYNYDGPTEIGGLVVAPSLRGSEEKPGKQLSYVRFLYMAMQPKAFRPRVLAELLPPLMPDGRSLFWEAYGKKFTGMDYAEADRLSRQNKEFIKELFPTSGVYATLFPERVQKSIGQVGPATLGVKHMLERIGFRYVHRVDPFDGGPHFEADLADITLLQESFDGRLSREPLEGEGQEALVGLLRTGKNRFRAVRCPAQAVRGTIRLPAWASEALKAPAGTKLSAIPF
jgi:arginine N-succinyltransferase